MRYKIITSKGSKTQNLFSEVNSFNSHFPDLLITLTNDLIVKELYSNQNFNHILIEKQELQLNQPIEFLFESTFAANIRNYIELSDESDQCEFQFPFNENQHNYYYEIRISRLNGVNQGNYLCIIRDITSKQLSRIQLEHRVNHDSLTSLPNRNNFYKTLNESIAECNDNNTICGIIFFDLDRFKSINDSLGHRIGDELLVAVASRIKNNLNNNEFIARISGDEFIIIVKAVEFESDVIDTAKRIYSNFKSAFELNNQIINIKASIGISLFPKNHSNPDALVQYADTAMYKAKELGGNQIRVFSEKQNTTAIQNFNLDQKLRRAIENNELFFVYQPLVCCKSGDIVGIEALIRWKPKNQELIPPSQFITVAELTGYINELGLWIINRVCSQINYWKQKKIKFKKVFINLSRRQLNDPELANSIFSIMDFHNVHHSEIAFEITEDSQLKSSEIVMFNLNQLQESGIKIAIDDFGTGYSSFSDLKNYPFSELKIDRSIIWDIGKESESSDAIIRAIISLGKELDLKIIAEGVENELQLEFLKKNNCQFIQGYLISKPLPTKDIEQLLKSHNFKLNY